MAKRFTDTRKWELPWYRNLTLVEKCFWSYVLDRCNHAGIWEVDFELASVYIGVKLDEKSLRRSLKDRFFEICKGRKWVMRNFIAFQYKQLNADVKAHKSVLDILEVEGLSYPYPKGSSKGLARVKDKDKDKDKAKDKDPKGLTKKEAERICQNGGV